MTHGTCNMARSQHGFTLVEAVAAILITGIAVVMVALFVRTPIQSYFDVAQRAELTDAADTALRRMARDIRSALPNSVRVSASGSRRALEFLQTRTGGRYRVEPGASGSGDVLDFSANDTAFDVLGHDDAEPAVTLKAGDQIVIYNLGIAGADAYAGDNRRAVSGTGGAADSVEIVSAAPFPFDSPAHRFQVVDTPVSYVCDLAAGTLTRFANYPIAVAQPNPPAVAGALLAQNVSDCAFEYAPGISERSGLVAIRLSLAKNNETVSLYHEVHVSNVP